MSNLQAISTSTDLGIIINIINFDTGEFEFIGKQLANILGFVSSKDMCRILDSREVRVANFAYLNDIKDLEALIGHELNPRGMTLVNLDGTKYILRSSNKPQATQFRLDVLPVIESHIKSLISKNNDTSTLNDIKSLLENQAEHNKQLQLETSTLKLQLNAQSVQTEQRLVTLKDELIKELKVRIQSGSYGVKTPRSSCDIDSYVIMFNKKYNKNINKTTVHLLLRKYDLINQTDTIPTKVGFDSGVVGREIFDIFYTNGIIGKSIKTVIYEEHFVHINKALLEFISK